MVKQMTRKTPISNLIFLQFLKTIPPFISLASYFQFFGIDINIISGYLESPIKWR